MSTGRKTIRVDKRIIAEMAWAKAVNEGKAFTADQLGYWCSMPTNRHFRLYLNSLAKIGLLAVKRQLCEDGHYRKFFYADFDKMKARFTKPLFDYEEKTA